MTADCRCVGTHRGGCFNATEPDAVVYVCASCGLSSYYDDGYSEEDGVTLCETCAASAPDDEDEADTNWMEATGWPV